MQRCIVVITFAFVFASCVNKSQSDLIVFRTAKEGLEQSNKIISNSTEVFYKGMQEKLAEASTAYVAAIWQPRSMMIKERTTAMMNYLDSIINKLKKEAGAKTENNEIVFREDDRDAVSRLFINQKTGEELYQKLKNYRQDILNVDPQLNKQFSKNSVITTEAFEFDANKEKDFTQTFFNNIPAIAALAVLSKFKNNVKVLENEFVAYCYYQIGSTDGAGFFTKFGVLIGQSTNIIKAGDQMQISAGVGSYSTQSRPIITINGKTFQSAATEGVVLYKFKTPLKSGKYYVPVKIEYIAEDGRKQMVTEKIEYTVVDNPVN